MITIRMLQFREKKAYRLAYSKALHKEFNKALPTVPVKKHSKRQRILNGLALILLK